MSFIDRLFRHSARILAPLVGVCLSTPVGAQYFGQNKVQYHDFDFDVLETEHFDIYYYPEEKEAVDLAARMAERWYERLSRVLEHNLRGRQPLILYAAHPHFRQTNAIPGPIGEGTGGVTESIKRRIVLPFAGPLRETDHVLGHELVHAFQYDFTGEDGRSAMGASRLPLWFVEGMAEYLSLGPVDPHTAMWLRDAARRDDLPTILELSRPEYFPYRYGHAFWSYLTGRWGDDVVGKVLRIASQNDPITAIEEATGLKAEELSEQWHEAIRSAHRPLIDQKNQPGAYGSVLIAEEKEGGAVNVAPSLDPDGRKLVFLSERDLFSIEMFVANVKTGEVEQKIVETATDPHFQSLQFIQSSGAWHPDGRRFVFSAIHEGNPVLTILDVERAERLQEIELPEVDEIFNPTWSPDGSRVAFSAIRGGLTDLFVYDLENDQLRSLTEDPYADIQPTWSPGGGQIAFVTDRFSTDLSRLATGNYRLALIDSSSGTIRPLPSFDNAKNINPQWSPGGDSLFFISDRTGVSNIYRLDIDRQAVFQLTDLISGVSGITGLSPAISTSAKTGELVFTTFEDNSYTLNLMVNSHTLAGTKVTERVASLAPAAVLPPRQRGESEVATLLRTPSEGIPPPDRDYPVSDYEADLDLDYIGQPYMIAGSDRFGAFVGGGISFFWSDMLGEHSLGTQVQVNGNFEDFAGLVGYQNRASRWIWGGVVSQIPFVTGSFQSGIAEVSGEPAVVEQIIRRRQVERELSGVLAYPFNEAKRIEFNSGFRHISFERKADTTAVSLRTGEVLVDETRDLPGGDSLTLGSASAAFVHDTTVFGPTSPILGSRYRLEGEATYGSIVFSDVLADYRHYFMPVRPFTLATRVLHAGRYGRDADDQRIAPLFVGYPNLVRGYDVSSFSASECQPGEVSGCRVFDQLFGSRMLVANLELRFPLVGAFRGEMSYGPLPVEVALFADTGVAWTSTFDPFFLGGDRDPVTSAGVAFRLAVQRFLVMEFDLVRPLDRPEKGWMFLFNFRPGF